MEKIIIDLEVKTDKALKDVKRLKNEFDGLESSVNDVSDASDKTKKSIDEVASNGGAIAILDQLTGGLATQFKNAYESTRLFNFSLKATKKALIATGIGALVVALGTVIAYWDDIVELVNRTNKKLEIQESNLTEQLKTQTLQLELLKQQIDIEVLRNGGSSKLTAEYRKQLLVQREQNIALLENLQTQLDIEKSKNKEATLWQTIKIAAAGQLGIGLQAEEVSKAINENSEKSVQIQEKINEAKKKTGAIDLQLAQIDNEANKKKKENAEKEKEIEKQKADDLEEIRKALIDTEDERRKEELRKIKADYDEKIKLAEKYYGEESEKVLALREAQKNAINNQQAIFDEQDEKKKKAKQDKEIADAKALEDLKNQIRDAEAVTEEERRQLEIQKTTEHYENLIALAKAKGLATEELENALAQKKLENQIANAEAERNLEKQKIRDKQMVVDAIAQFANAETGIGRALLIAKQVLALKETIMDMKRITFKGKQAIAEAGVSQAKNVSESSKIGFPQNIITIAAAIAQGVGIIRSVRQAVAKTNVSVGGVGESTPSVATPTQSAPPAFNVVGQSQTSQLAQTIAGQQNEPVKAYVVADDVSTAQSLDRNIVEGASI